MSRDFDCPWIINRKKNKAHWIPIFLTPSLSNFTKCKFGPALSTVNHSTNLSAFKCGLVSEITRPVKGCQHIQSVALWAAHPSPRPKLRLLLHLLPHTLMRPPDTGGAGLRLQPERHGYTKPSRRLWNQRALQSLRQCEWRGDGQPEVSVVSPVSTFGDVYTAKKKRRRKRRRNRWRPTSRTFH